jgi:hypothetical protein
MRTLSASLSTAQPVDRESTRSQTRQTADRRSDRQEEKRLTRPNNRSMTDDGRFSIDLARVPPGFVMEFKRHEIMGMRDVRNQVTVRTYHWEPVTHKMQPQFYGHLCEDPEKQVVVDGLGLYMRPKYLNDDAMRETEQDTHRQLHSQLNSLRMSSKGQVGQMNTYIKKTGVVPVPQTVE